MLKRKNRNIVKQGGIGYNVFQLVSACFFALFAFICLYPFWYVVIYALSDTSRIAGGLTFLPKGFTLRYFGMVFQMPNIYNAFLISVLRAVTGTALTLFFSAMFAFVLTKSRLPGRRIIYRLLVISMYIEVGLIPWYLMMRAYGLRNNFLLYILPYAITAYYVVLIKTFIEGIPEALEEAALIDGANYFQVFTKIILPVSMPVLAAVAVFSMVGQWNSWTDNFYLVSDGKLQTLQYMLLRLLRQTEAIAAAVRSGNTQAMRSASVSPMSIRMTTTVVTVIPVLLVYPLLQRYFVKGIMLGAVKA